MSDEILSAVYARPKRLQGVTGQTIEAQMRGTMCQITEWELEESRDELDRLRAEVESLAKALATVQRAARTLHAAGQEITRNAVAAALGDAVAMREIDRTEYTAAASLDSERQANAMLTDALERAESALADEREHADALAGALEIFATDRNWQQGGPLDPCSPSFTGTAMASAVAKQHRARRQA